VNEKRGVGTHEIVGYPRGLFVMERAKVVRSSGGTRSLRCQPSGGGASHSDARPDLGTWTVSRSFLSELVAIVCVVTIPL
jgi:hypothetical protein